MRGVRSLLLPLALLAGLCAGCAGDGGSTDGGDDQAPEDNLELVGHESRPPPTKDSFAPETAEWMEESLRHFGDASWHERRQQWLGLGETEARFLVYNMFAGLLRAQQAGRLDMVERFRHELVLIGPYSVEMCADLLATSELFTAIDRNTGEEKTLRVDDAPRAEAAQILSLIGPDAVELTVWAAENADSKSGTLSALRALGGMGDRGGRPAAAGVEQWLESEDWVVRSEAVLQLGSFSDETSRDALIGALHDDEELVRTRAAASLAKRGEKGALPALQAAAESAEAEGSLVELRAFRRAVHRIESRAE